MSSKEVELPGIGRVVLTKRRASRSIRLRVGHDGTPHVSLPIWLSYKQALLFIADKKDWIAKQQSQRSQPVYAEGLRLGKSHSLRFAIGSGESIRTTVKGNEVTVFYPPTFEPSDPKVTAAAERLAVRVLKKESEALLPQRLAHLAQTHGYTYSAVKIGKMRSRWGSCSNQKLITLNCYLIQLPWHLIDYVLIHELVHTEVMSHGEEFWQRLTEAVPDVKLRRKELKTHNTSIVTTQA